MYWRVRKITPEQLVTKYSIHIILAVSLFFNFILFISRPKPNALGKEQKTDFANFVKQVTIQLFDTSYINYAQSTQALTAELDGPLITRLKQQGALPQSQEDFKANLMQYEKTKRVCAVQITSIDVKELTKNGLVPIEVRGVAAVHSADESDLQPFHLLFFVGQKKKTDPSDPDVPLVAEMQELPLDQPVAAAEPAANGPTP